MSQRRQQVVLFGATGFTGRLVAEQLLKAARETPFSWALAGRNLAKLEEIRAALSVDYPEAKSVPLLIADSANPESLAKLAGETQVIATTVGPYGRYGSGLVQACAEAGTHYCDLTGEVPWMRQMIDAHEATARQSGARIVFTCGFDSIPSDLGVFFTQQQCLSRWGHPAARITGLFGESSGGFSGGTAESLKDLMADIREKPEIRRLLANPYSLNPSAEFRGPDRRDSMSVARAPHLNLWMAPFFMAPVNTRVVRRGHALMNFPWGAEFEYDERLSFPPGFAGGLAAAGVSVGLTVGIGLLASPLRGLVERNLPAAGDGPSEEARKKGHWVMRIVAEAGEKWLKTEIGDAHADPGYGSTAKMLAQAALCLAMDDLTVGGGMWTPASAMGAPLIERLQRAGIRFETRL